MKTVIYSQEEIENFPKLNQENDNIRKISETEILKIANPMYHSHPKLKLDKKYDDSEEFGDISELVLPTSKVKVTNGLTVGAIYPYQNYPSLMEQNWEENHSLSYYIKRHQSLEKIVEKCAKKGILIPDLPTLSNILQTENGYRLIDYENMQIKDSPTIAISNVLPKELMANEKYRTPEKLYTENLAPLATISLFLLDTFHILYKEFFEIYQRSPLGAQTSLEILGISSCEELTQKILNLTNLKLENQYLEETFELLQDKYILNTESMFGIKKRILIKK